MRFAALGARDAVAQAGYRNRDGHPDPGVAARYPEAGIGLRRTDHAAALQWRMQRHGGARLSAWRTEAVRSWHNRPGPRAAADPGADEHPTVPFPGEPFIAG